MQDDAITPCCYDTVAGKDVVFVYFNRSFASSHFLLYYENKEMSYLYCNILCTVFVAGVG